MTVVNDAGEVLESADGLRFARTVDRALVHRRNIAEVFLTDVLRTGADSFVAAAQLPAVHPHYTSHTGPSGFVDAMLLLECCRQAETCAAHVVHAVDLDVSFVLRHWSMRLHPDALILATGPTDLVMSVVTRAPILVAGRLRGLTYEFELWASGTRLGDVRMEVGYVARAAYLAMRAKGRTGPVPSSDDQPPAVTGQLVPPAQVGRFRETDTLLLDVARNPARNPGTSRAAVSAVLRVPVENPSLFDHAQDHVPGMVLVEAARQLAVLATAHRGGGVPERLRMAGMEASFSAYAELDAPITLTAVARPECGTVEVTSHQSGRQTCQVSITLTEVGR